jgi:hypothetical protein
VTRQIGGHAETLAAVDALHQPVSRSLGTVSLGTTCAECTQAWPCATHRLIGSHSRHNRGPRTVSPVASS